MAVAQATSALVTGARNALTSLGKNPTVREGAQKLAAKALGNDRAAIAFSDPKAVTDPRTASVVMQAAARAGVPPGDIMRGIELRRTDLATSRMFASLSTAFEQGQQVLDSKFAINGRRDYTQRALDRETASWAIRHFGSKGAATRAHAELRAFLAIDSDELHEFLNQA